MTAPAFSIIVPCYKSASTLEDTLNSIQSQTFHDWECILVDDGSPDTCKEIGTKMSAANPRFRIVSQRNQGLSSARNTGIREARGSWLLFLDSDDVIAPGKLAIHHACLRSFGFVDNVVTYSSCRYFKDHLSADKTLGKDGSNTPWMSGVSGSGQPILEKLAHCNIAPVSSPIISNRIAKLIGGFDPQLKSFEDWDFWIRCTLAGGFWQFIESELAETWIRVTHGSMSTNSNRMFFAELQVRRKHASVPAMKAKVNSLRKFHAKAIVSNLLSREWKMALRRIPYIFTLR